MIVTLQTERVRTLDQVRAFVEGRVSRWQDRRPLPAVIIVKTTREAGPDAKRKLILAACCGTHGVQDGLTASIYVLLPVLAQTFGLGYAQVGMLRAVHGGATGVLELPSGMLSERFGQRGLLAFGLLCGGAGYLAMSMAGGFHGVLPGLCIAGCGAAFQYSLCSSLVSGWFEGPARAPRSARTLAVAAFRSAFVASGSIAMRRSAFVASSP